MTSTSHKVLQNLDDFPGWAKASAYLKQYILDNDCKVIGDIGGGANPMIDIDFIEKHGLEYYVFDISQSELDKADPRYRKIQLDITCDAAEFAKQHIRQDFDFVFSHMMMEHIQDPLKAHANFARLLHKGGLSVHLYPSMNNFPLFVNRLIPEKLSTAILMKLQPDRANEGINGKFPAYYKYCGAPNQALQNTFQREGFEIVQHTAYIGHEYYKRIKPLAALELQLRKLLIALRIPMVSANLLILKKQVE